MHSFPRTSILLHHSLIHILTVQKLMAFWWKTKKYKLFCMTRTDNHFPLCSIASPPEELSIHSEKLEAEHSNSLPVALKQTNISPNATRWLILFPPKISREKVQWAINDERIIQFTVDWNPFTRAVKKTMHFWEGELFESLNLNLCSSLHRGRLMHAERPRVPACFLQRVSSTVHNWFE